MAALEGGVDRRKELLERQVAGGTEQQECVVHEFLAGLDGCGRRREHDAAGAVEANQWMMGKAIDLINTWDELEPEPDTRTLRVTAAVLPDWLVERHDRQQLCSFP